jgi:hypothetical protein
MSRQTWVSSETRGGQSGLWGSFGVAFDLTRRAMVDDQFAAGELHLLRLMPRAWLSNRRETVFDNVPTEFGVVNLRLRQTPDRGSLQVAFHPRFREIPRKIVLHVPPVDAVDRIVVNDKAVEWDRKVRSSELPPDAWRDSQ